MKTKLRKKIEKDANMLYPIHAHTNNYGKLVDLNEYQRLAFIDGIEYGYLKAITLTKEWLKEQGKEWWEGYGLPFSLTDFENHLNKLWEV